MGKGDRFWPVTGVANYPLFGSFDDKNGRVAPLVVARLSAHAAAAAFRVVASSVVRAHHRQCDVTFRVGSLLNRARQGVIRHRR